MLARYLRRACQSLAFRLRRREQFAALRGSPLLGAGFPPCETQALLARLPTPPAVVYDLGANRGQWTLLVKSLYPAAIVHAFEPLPAHADEFARHTHPLSGITLHRVALGEQEAELELDVTSFSDAASLLPPSSTLETTYGVRSGQKTRVPVVTLDGWSAGHALPFADLIKLDLQGYELHALRGARAQLAQAKAVILELSFREFYVGQPSPGSVISFLEASGFALEAVAPDITAGASLNQADALFLRRA